MKRYLKPLVRLGGSLAGFLHGVSIRNNTKGKSRGKVKTYQLVKVPTADAEVALVLIHAVAEVTDVNFTGGVLV